MAQASDTTQQEQATSSNAAAAQNSNLVSNTTINTTRRRSSTKIEPIATQQLQDRALVALANNQLLMRYAIANDLSTPKVRVYFEKLAAGFEPTPIIKNWDVFDDDW